MEVLVAATRTGARFLRREDDLGTIEEGKLADLLIIGGDPLGDIREARNIETVIVGGLMLDPAEVVKPPPPNGKPAASGGGRL